MESLMINFFLSFHIQTTISSTSLGRFITNDIQLVSLLKLSHAQLLPSETTSYRNIGLTKLLSPIYQGVFDNENYLIN